MDRAFAGRFPFGFGHVRSAVPELQACRQTLATAARGRQWNAGASAGGQSCGYGGGTQGGARERCDWTQLGLRDRGPRSGCGSGRSWRGRDYAKSPTNDRPRWISRIGNRGCQDKSKDYRCRRSQLTKRLSLPPPSCGSVQELGRFCRSGNWTRVFSGAHGWYPRQQSQCQPARARSRERGKSARADWRTPGHDFGGPINIPSTG